MRELLVLGMMGVCASGFAACSSDSDDDTIANGNEAGATGEAGAQGEAGEASQGGAPGGGGESGAAGDDGRSPFPEVLDPVSVIVPGVEPKRAHLLVAGTDFVAGKSEVASVSFDPPSVSEPKTYDDTDVVVASGAGLGFVLQRSSDKIDLVVNGEVEKTFDLEEQGRDDARPVENKAYVGLYNASLVTVLDLDAGHVSRRIDLREFEDASDADHSADVGAAVYEAKSKIAYYSLSRIDRTTIVGPDYHLPCGDTRGLIVGIDTRDDSIVDLNGDEPGKAIELKLRSQANMQLSADGNSLFVLSSGCYTGATLKQAGVEVVDLESASSSVVYAPTGEDFLAGLVLVSGGNALVNSYDDMGAEHWHKLDLTAGKLGDELADVPGGPSFDGKDLVGVGIDGAIVRYDVTTGAVTALTTSSLEEAYDAAYSTALVK